MGFALFALSSLYQPLRRIAGSMRQQRPAHHGLPKPTSAAYRCASTASNDPQCPAIDVPAAHQGITQGHARPIHSPGSTPNPVAARPLRVILNRQEGKSCRLVISGRMADVCAELNRLALH